MVVAYGKSGKRAVVGSTANSATVTTEVAFAEFDEETETLTSTLAGMSAGIQVRGTGTIAGQAPMIVVNGVPYDGALSDFDQGSILSMNLVRDANTAIYGTRAANGIIFIETSDRNGRAATASRSRPACRTTRCAPISTTTHSGSPA